MIMIHREIGANYSNILPSDKAGIQEIDIHSRIIKPSFLASLLAVANHKLVIEWAKTCSTGPVSDMD